MHSLPNDLICRSSVLPHESLASLLVRLGVRNFFDPPTNVHQLYLEILPRHSQRQVAARRILALFNHITARTKLQMSDLYQATAHRFAQVLTPPEDALEMFELPGLGEVPLLGALVVRRHLRSESAGQWCPMCLQERPYYRLHWQPVAVAACLQHSCLLVHRCGTCSRPVPERQIMEAVCRSCGADLTTTPTVSLSSDRWGLTTQSIIQSWLMTGATPTADVNGLPMQPPRTLFRILDGLRLAAAVAEPTWSHLHPLPSMPPAWMPARSAREHPAPFQSYYLYATAMKGLAQWPQGFVTWLSAYRERGPIPRRGRLGVDLGVVYQTWIARAWQYPAFQFLQDVFNQYLTDNYSADQSIWQSRRYRQNPDLTAQFPYVSTAEAARMLGVTPKAIGWLIVVERLSPHPMGDTPSSSITFVRRSDVQALHECWQRSFPLDDAAQLLNLSPVVTVDLVKIGLLSAEYGSSVGDTDQWRFTLQGLERCVSRVAEHVRSSPQAVSAGASLVQAADILASVGLNVARILKQVADGQLSGYRATVDDLRLGSIWFAHNDLSHYIETFIAAQNWIAHDDVLKQLGVKRSTLARWVDAGLITPVAIHANAHYFNRGDVMTFWDRYIKSDAAAEIVGVGRIAIQEWVREGRFGDVCVSGIHLDGYHAYLFDRERLLAWRRSRMTVGEVQHLLGVSTATVHRYVIEGKLTPLDNAHGPHPHRWFARAEVEALRTAV